jgi:hypothetical protein
VVDVSYLEKVLYDICRREIIQWHNTATLVDLYNECLGEIYEPISMRWWQRMEKDNKIPQDKKRRWIIATLLHLPPAYLGLTALPSFFPLQEETITVPVKSVPLDLEDYEKKLKKLWGPYSSREAAADSILSRIYTLERALMYGGAQQKEQVARLLCQYLIAFGNILRAQGCSSSLMYFSEAVALAEEKKVLGTVC